MIRLICFLLILPVCLNAQVIENFSDGEFSSNPVWSGDTADFEINSSSQLHLKSSGADTSVMAIEISPSGEMEWQCWVKQSFNSSANNFSRIYLCYDTSDLQLPGCGFFMQVGGSDDSLRVHYQEGTNGTDLFTIPGVTAGGSTNPFRFRITRDQNGLWSFYVDPAGGQSLAHAGDFSCSIPVAGRWFGVYCKYTSSNATKCYFDDFYIGPVIRDTIPPVITRADITHPYQAELLFSEPLRPAEVSQMGNFTLSPGAGHPLSTELDALNPSLVHLVFAVAFEQITPYQLQVNGIFDVQGNLMAPQVMDMIFYTPAAHDVLINEIFADPDPMVGLPDAEFLELYNTTDYPVLLTGWKLKVSSSEMVLPYARIGPKSFLILCREDAYYGFGPYVGLFTSESTLPNSGTEITLRNSSDQVIHHVKYDLAWYQDKIKERGGWSLEMVDPSNPCGCMRNWTASLADPGGTPGKVNAVFASNPDSIPPYLKRAALLDDGSIRVYFSEPMDSLSLFQEANFLMDNLGGAFSQVVPQPPGYTSVWLQPVQVFADTSIRRIAITGGVTDCAGNPILEEKILRVAKPSRADSGDLIIDEVLFDPLDHGVPYVELLNMSKKVLDISTLSIASVDLVTGQIKQECPVSTESYLFFPKEYVLLSSNQVHVKKQYLIEDPDAFLDVPDMPGLYVGGGSVMISGTSDRRCLEKVFYHPDMQFPLLESHDGVALERISFYRPGTDPTNWHSAAGTSGYGTPGYQNSIYYYDLTITTEINMIPTIFSPNGDGYHEYATLQVNFNLPGYMVNIYIYNSKGAFIRHLIKNTLAGTHCSFIWDGTDEKGRKCDIGLYVFYMEVYTLERSRKHIFKKSVILADIF